MSARLWPRHTGVAPRYAAFSDVGPVRRQNEDACGAFGPEDGRPGEHLFVVADGMGGHAHGKEASTLALAAVHGAFFGADGPAEERLRRAVEDANRRVWERARADGRTEIMGTTCTALAFADGRALAAHVGDSRLYRLEGRRARQLTRDHTLVEELRRTGALTDAEARTHPRRNALTRALGIAPEAEVDVLPLGPLRRGDRFLLCSDGLGPVPADEIAAVLLREEPEAACRALVARAAEAGSTDNATAVVVHV
jgi:protein phosphatase